MTVGADGSFQTQHERNSGVSNSLRVKIELKKMSDRKYGHL